MKRLVIMACYSPNGQVEEFKQKLIKEIKKHADCFFIVCNGKITEQAYIFLEREATVVMIRANIGYDAGAYKDAISQIDLNKYDELLILNDTFYGFLYPLDEFMEKTKRQKNVDFWGLTKHPGGENSFGSFGEHVQAYFLLIKSKMLHSREFLEFWKELSYPVSYSEAIWEFEIKFTAFFRERGFKYAVYCDLKLLGIESQYNINPYGYYPYELIGQLRCPVLKRKSLRIGNGNIWETIKYIGDNHLYDIELIWQQVMEDYRYRTNFSYFNLYELEKFINHYSRIYIYGKGRYGTAMQDYLKFRNYTFKKFIVSKRENRNDDDTIELSELQASVNIGIIVALKPQYTREVMGELLKCVSREQLFCGTWSEQ